MNRTPLLSMFSVAGSVLCLISTPVNRVYVKTVAKRLKNIQQVLEGNKKKIITETKIVP